LAFAGASGFNAITPRTILDSEKVAMSTNHDRLVLENGKLTIATAEGKVFEGTVHDLEAVMRRKYQPPLNGAARPDGFKFHEWSPPLLCVVHQMSPRVHQVRWITDDSPAPYGPKAKFKPREISLPYAITFAMYRLIESGLSLIGYDELYFRNEPLKTREDTLGYPALLNVSKINQNGRLRAWICTQHLQLNSKRNWTEQLGQLLEHTWDGSFNLSSEHHEGASWYGESQGIHPDLHPIERWVKATKKDKAFALKVPWKPVPLNVDQIIDAMLQECGARSPAVATHKAKSSDIVGELLNYLQKEKTKS
jgi:hypothetical protein